MDAGRMGPALGWLTVQLAVAPDPDRHWEHLGGEEESVAWGGAQPGLRTTGLESASQT